MLPSYVIIFSPVVQLSRISAIRPDSKATKQRSELVFAVDTLTSHLQTTFTALSSAFAERERKNFPGPTDRDRRIPTSRAYMMFVLGPSVGAAKAKIALVADGLEAQPWDDKGGLALVNGPGNRSIDSPTDSTRQSHSAEEDSGAESGDASEHDEVDECEVAAEEFEYANAEQPPPSRSPSPSSPRSAFPSLSRPASPPLGAPRPAGLSLLSASESALRNHARMMPPPLRTQPEEEDRLRSADRLLSRTLANACAGDDGGMSCELGISQSYDPNTGSSIYARYSCNADARSPKSSSPIRPSLMGSPAKPDSELGKHAMYIPRRSSTGYASRQC